MPRSYRNVDDHHDGRIDFAQWCVRVIGWDGLLPISVGFISLSVAQLFPNNRRLAEFLMVLLPIIAVLIRFKVGTSHIADNHCGIAWRRFQCLALCMAVLLFMFADFFIVMAAFANQRNNGLPPDVDKVWVGFVTIYLSLVTIAMYPGRSAHNPRANKSLV